MCYAFSLPSTAFTRQTNRATAETAQEAALAEGLAPLLGWVKRLADHVIQDRMGAGDLEFAWEEGRAADPSEQAKMLDLYVRGGIWTVNEARDLLGLGPVAGGGRPLVYTAAGPIPLAAATENSLSRNAGEGGPLASRAVGEGDGPRGVAPSPQPSPPMGEREPRDTGSASPRPAESGFSGHPDFRLSAR